MMMKWEKAGEMSMLGLRGSNGDDDSVKKPISASGRGGYGREQTDIFRVGKNRRCQSVIMTTG